MRVRLPTRFQTRWSYAAAAWLSVFFCFGGGLGIFGLLSGEGWVPASLLGSPVLGALAGLVPAGIAARLFPPAPRSRIDMTYAGIAVVLACFLAIGVILLAAVLLSPSSWESLGTLTSGVGAALVLAFGILVAGTLFTLGLPFWIGVLVSQLFVTAERQTVDAALDSFVSQTLGGDP